MGGYTAVYNSTDVKNATIDVVAGVVTGLADLANPLGLVIVAGIVLGILFGVINLLRRQA